MSGKAILQIKVENKSQQKNANIFSCVGIKYVVIGRAIQAGF